jgi:hypothetical protein
MKSGDRLTVLSRVGHSPEVAVLLCQCFNVINPSSLPPKVTRHRRMTLSFDCEVSPKKSCRQV